MDWVQLEWLEVPLVLVDLALEALMVVESVVAILPHGFVPGAGSIWGNSYVIGRVSMSHMD